MLRILLIAYACEPNSGSEPGVGWHWSNELARNYDVHVLTRSNNRPSIEAEDTKENLKFHYYDPPTWLIRWKPVIGINLFHFFWQLGAISHVRAIVKKNRIILIHQITLGGVWNTSVIGYLTPYFIWGPFGGGETSYFRSTSEWQTAERLREIVRGLMVRLVFWLNPFVLLSYSKADLILVRTGSTLRKIPPPFRQKCKRSLETRVTPPSEELIFESIDLRETSLTNRLQISVIGRLVPYKNVVLALEVLKKLLESSPHAFLQIVGDGSCSSDLLRKVEELQITNHVEFIGQVSSERVYDILRSSHILLHPAVRDGGAWVLFEAIASGVPVVAYDNAGPGELINDRLGKKIAVGTHDQSVDCFAEAIAELTTSAATWRASSHSAYKYANSELSWSSLLQSIPQYDQIAEKALSEQD